MSVDLDQFRALGLRAIRELSSVPWYVIWQPADLPAPQHSRAYAIAGSAAMKRHLEVTGQWHGEGWCIVFVDRTMARDQALQVFAHELGHIVPVVESVPIETTPEAIAADVQAIAAWSEAPEPSIAGVPPWAIGLHDKAYVRRCLHVWWRFAMLGEFVRLDGLCNSLLYGLSPEFCFWSALGCEPVKMQRKSFAEIEATEPPALFSEIWDSDLRQWMKNNRTVAA